MKYILVFLLTFNCFAQDIVELNKGDAAPFRGALVSPEQMQEFRQINEDKKRVDLQNIKLKDLADVNEQRIDFYKSEVKNVQNQFARERTKHFFEKIGYFALGVVVTSVAAKAAIEASR